MTISSLALAAKKVIDAAWRNGPAYDLSSQAAFALESAQLLQSPETAAELARLRERNAAAPAELTPEQRTVLAALLADAKPATTTFVTSVAEAVRDVREHKHPKWEDLYCQNLLMWLGERMGPVLRRLLDAEARVAELEAAHADAVDVSETLSRTLHDEMLAGSALYAALTMPTTPEQRQAALDRFTAVAQRHGQKHAPCAADGITARIAPTQALQLEDPHDSPLHHPYRVGRDLPETGGASC